MSEKQRSRFKEGLIKLFGEQSWFVTNWFTNQIEGNEGILQLQNRELLVKLLDSFPGKLEIDNPDFLRFLNDWSGVELHGQLPQIKGTAYVVGNYIGREPDAQTPPFLDPTIWCLVKLFEVAQTLALDEVTAVARDTAFDGMDGRLRGALGSHIAFAKKDNSGEYTLPFKEKYKLARTVKARTGMLWTAPAATTTMNGLKFDRLTTSSIRQAMESENAQLLTLAMIASQDRERALAIEMDEVQLPRVAVPKELKLKAQQQVEILREVNYQILLWAYGQTASHLPEGQRGQFEDYVQAQKRVVWTLRGMEKEGLIKIDGGFIMNS